MIRHTSLTLAAALLATTIGAASAQTPQDHAAHHSDTAPAATDTNASANKGCPTGDLAAAGKTDGETPMGNMGAMMGGGMGQMMQMMGGGMMGGGMAMAPFAHIEGRIAFLKAELSITDAQAPQWS